MTKKQKDKLTAATTGMAYLVTNLTLVTPVTDIITNKTDCDTLIGVINTKETAQNQNNKGTTTDKSSKRGDLEIACTNVIGKVVGSVYCKTNSILKGLIKRTPSQLDRMGPQSLINFANSIVTNIPSATLLLLVGSGLVAADLTNITTKVTAFNPVKAAPKTAIGIRKAATQTMKPNFITLTQYIIDISGLFINLISNNDLYNGWFDVVKVFKTGIHYTRKFGVLPVSPLAPAFYWAKVIKNSVIKNTATVGNLRVGAGKKMGDVITWTTIAPGTEFLNTLGADVIVDSLFPTGIVTYELHSKSRKGKRLV
jgi:hypothetical protein